MEPVKSETGELPEKNDAQQQPKKPYTTPQLIIHGTVEEITGALGGGTKDGLTGSLLL